MYAFNLNIQCNLKKFKFTFNICITLEGQRDEKQIASSLICFLLNCQAKRLHLQLTTNLI